MKKTEMTAGLMALGLVLAGCSSAAKEEQAPVQPQDPVTEKTESEKTVQNSLAEAEFLKDQTGEETEKEPQEPVQPEAPAGTGQIRPEFKAAMDEYVAFYEDYAAFMQRYRQNPSDLNLLLEMTDWMTRTQSVTEELDKLEASQQEMNAAELRYYLDATGRILELMSQAAS